jgi:2-C-methyl-D-erythritol 2,4-cyclodiphosphate synthase
MTFSARKGPQADPWRIEIPHDSGLYGHSDADVLTHALIDALLGAAALGDIGKLFPDTSAEYKDISSILLL